MQLSQESVMGSAPLTLIVLDSVLEPVVGSGSAPNGARDRGAFGRRRCPQDAPRMAVAFGSLRGSGLWRVNRSIRQADSPRGVPRRAPVS